jgi:hypothetical protein
MSCPQKAKELFNLRHCSSAKGISYIVEIGFGQLKRRFPIFDHLPKYPHDIYANTDYLFILFSLFNYLIKLYDKDNTYCTYDMEMRIIDRIPTISYLRPPFMVCPFSDCMLLQQVGFLLVIQLLGFDYSMVVYFKRKANFVVVASV